MSEAQWIRFVEHRQLPGRKTRAWNVLSRDGGYALGEVSWHSPWRRFCFKVGGYASAVFEEDCLRDIAEFVEARTREYKAAQRAAIRVPSRGR